MQVSILSSSSPADRFKWHQLHPFILFSSFGSGTLLDTGSLDLSKIDKTRFSVPGCSLIAARSAVHSFSSSCTWGSLPPSRCSLGPGSWRIQPEALYCYTVASPWPLFLTGFFSFEAAIHRAFISFYSYAFRPLLAGLQLTVFPVHRLSLTCFSATIYEFSMPVT